MPVFLEMLKIPKFAKIAVFLKMANFGLFLKIGKKCKNAKNAKMAKIPQNGKMPKNGVLGKYPKIEILAAAMANTPGRLDVVIILKTTPGYPFYILLLMVYILHYL